MELCTDFILGECSHKVKKELHKGRCNESAVKVAKERVREPREKWRE